MNNKKFIHNQSNCEKFVYRVSDNKDFFDPNVSMTDTLFNNKNELNTKWKILGFNFCYSCLVLEYSRSMNLI